MQTVVERISGRAASAALAGALISVVLIASLPLAGQASVRQPAATAVAGKALANDNLITPSGRPIGKRQTASTQVMARPLSKPVSYAMPSIPRPAQSLIPDALRERPMTTLEYASTLRAPLGRLQVSSSYGLRMHPLAKRELFHHGIDYVAPMGTPIRAAQDGQIKEMRGRPGFGYVVRMRHSHGVETVYGHMLKFMPGLKKDSVVRRGDIIGFVGSTGRSTGAHLHFEVLADGKQVDPMQLTIAFASDRLLSMK